MPDWFIWLVGGITLLVNGLGILHVVFGNPEEQRQGRNIITTYWAAVAVLLLSTAAIQGLKYVIGLF